MENNKKTHKIHIVSRFKTVHGIVEMALLVAIAVVFDLDILKLSFGDNVSVSLTMLALFIIALRFNLLDSFLGIGVVYGIITLILDGSLLISYPLDYVLGYGSLAVISLFRSFVFNKDTKLVYRYLILAGAVIIGVSARVMWSTISGILIYETPLLGSFVYNAPAMYVSGAICLVALYLLYPALLVVNKSLENKS